MEEICIRYINEPWVCLSREHVQEMDIRRDVFYIKEEADKAASPIIPTCPRVSRDAIGSALTGEFCRHSSDCAGTRQCLRFPNICCTKNHKSCICFEKEPRLCRKQDDCADGEVCAKGRKLPPRCVSAKALRTGINEFINLHKVEEAKVEEVGSEGMRGTVCIAVHLLAHIPDSSLLYDEPQTARVLCDANGSCATGGHIVKFQRSPMMMSSYCKRISGCVERIMWVNSPTYQRGLEVPSRSPNLTFTSFAARYETKAEELILQAAVHAGL